MSSDLIENHLRPIVLECLRKSPRNGYWSLQELWSEVAKKAKSRGLNYATGIPAWQETKGSPLLHPNIEQPVANIVWELILEGIVRPGYVKSSLFGLPHFHVSEHGSVAINESVTPYDPDGYIRSLKERIPDVDKTILRYIEESATTLRRNCLLSSTITLGCASEKAFLLLLESYSDGLNPEHKKQFDGKIKKCRGVKKQYIAFMECFNANLLPALKSARMNSDSLTEIESSLKFVFDYFRTMRNDAGHPTGTILSKEVVHSHLVVFPPYLRALYNLMEWISSNKPLAM